MPVPYTALPRHRPSSGRPAPIEDVALHVPASMLSGGRQRLGSDACFGLVSEALPVLFVDVATPYAVLRPPKTLSSFRLASSTRLA